MIILLSVPHTGTRFSMAFLNSIKVLYRQYHSEKAAVDDLRHEKSNKVLIPVRDPLLAYTSRLLRVNDYRIVLKEVVMNYTLLLEMESWFSDIEYLRLNTEDRPAELQSVADFCGYDGPITFTWETVGSLKPKATDYTIWDIISEELEDGEKEKALESLEPFRKHYGY